MIALKRYEIRNAKDRVIGVTATLAEARRFIKIRKYEEDRDNDQMNRERQNEKLSIWLVKEKKIRGGKNGQIERN